MYFKKLIFPVLFLFCHSLFGQMGLKIYGGIAISSPAIDAFNNPSYAEQFSSISLPFLGLQLQSGFNKYMSLNADFQFCAKGQILETGYGDFHHKLVYLDIIPSIDFNLTSKFKIGVGVYASAKLKDLSDTFPFTYGILKRDWDYGLNLGTAIELKRFTFRLLYLYGIYDTFRSTVTGKFKHRVLQFGIGYSLVDNKVKDKKSR